jgi:hypothetical protein
VSGDKCGQGYHIPGFLTKDKRTGSTECRGAYAFFFNRSSEAFDCSAARRFFAKESDELSALSKLSYRIFQFENARKAMSDLVGDFYGIAWIVYCASWSRHIDELMRRQDVGWISRVLWHNSP